MHIDFADLTPQQAYFQLIQTIVPRPIAWVLSENAGGGYNLAPFSFFNAVCSDPPLIMISVGRKPDGSLKDTAVNITQRNAFVVHVAHLELLEALNDSSATLASGVSELERAGLATVPMHGSRLPRIADARVAFACERHSIQEIGGAPQTLILGRVRSLYLDDAITSHADRGRLKVHAERLDPIGRLGASEYVTFGEIRSLPRPQ